MHAVCTQSRVCSDILHSSFVRGISCPTTVGHQCVHSFSIKGMRFLFKFQTYEGFIISELGLAKLVVAMNNEGQEEYGITIDDSMMLWKEMLITMVVRARDIVITVGNLIGSCHC